MCFINTVQTSQIPSNNFSLKQQASSILIRGKYYKKLSHRERWARLEAVVSICTMKLMTFGCYSSSKEGVQRCWKEFKTGRKKVNVCFVKTPSDKRAPERVSPNHRQGRATATTTKLGQKNLLKEDTKPLNKKIYIQTWSEILRISKAVSELTIYTQRFKLNRYSQKSIEELKKVKPEKLVQTMEYCTKLSERPSISTKDKILIKNFFNKFIEAIKNEDINENNAIANPFFKKMIDHGYQPNPLFAGKWKLQQIISEDLAKAMANVAHADANLSVKGREELLLRRSFYRGILAGDLNGNRYKPAGGGVNGAVFFRHLESGLKTAEALLPGEESHQPFVGVFKPHPDTVLEFKGWFDTSAWGERVKSVAGMDAHLNKKDPDNRVHNEIFAYELFHIFGFNAHIGFPTTLKFINKNDDKKRPASFCAFTPGLDIVASHVKNVTKEKAKSNVLDSDKIKYRANELHIWEMSKIFDFLTGNMDGHEGNAFVKIEKGRIVGAVNFDYDKAFAIEKTKNINNQYKWAKLKISENDFTKETRKALYLMLKGPHAEKKIADFLAKARKGGVNDQKFTQAQEMLLRERVAILKKIARGEIQKLSDLANYK